MALETKKTVCMFCSMGCGMLISTDRGNPIEIEYDFDNPINKGSVCPRGNYMFELLGHPSRLEGPKIRKDNLPTEVSWREALSDVAHNLREIKRRHGGDSIGIIMDPNSLNEEIFLGYCLAREVLKTKNFSIAFAPEDRDMLVSNDEFCLKRTEQAAIDDIRKSNALLIIGDILTKTPCLSKEINKVKYDAKDNRVIVVDPKKSNTSWFANSHLMCSPGEEAMLLAGMIKALLSAKGKKVSSLGKKFKRLDLKAVSSRTGITQSDILKAAHEFNAAKKATIVLCSNFGKTSDAGLLVKLAKILCSVAKGDKKMVSFYTGANSLGSYLTLNILSKGKVFPDYLEVLDAAKKGKIKAIISFGVDISRAVSDESFNQIRDKVKLLVTSHLFENNGTLSSRVVLPAASYAEKKGSLISSGGVLQELMPVLPPYSGSMPYFDMLSDLLGVLGGKTMTLEQVTQEIKSKLKKMKQKIKGNIAQALKALKDIKTVKGSSDKPFVFLPDDDIVHYGSGSLSEKCFWAKENCSEPYIELSSLDSGSLKIGNGDKVRVSSGKETSYLKARVTERVSKGVVSAPHHFGEVKKLFDVKIDPKKHTVSIKPEVVSIEKE